MRGNHERWFTQSKGMLLSDATPEESLSEGAIAWLRGLPVLQTIPTVSGAALLCHSLGRDDLSRLRPDDPIDLDHPPRAAAGCRFVIDGHTRLPMVHEVGHVVVLNAGTLSRSHDSVVMTPVRRERVPHPRSPEHPSTSPFKVPCARRRALKDYRFYRSRTGCSPPRRWGSGVGPHPRQ